MHNTTNDIVTSEKVNTNDKKDNKITQLVQKVVHGIMHGEWCFNKQTNSKTINFDIGNGFVNEEWDETKQDSINLISEELVLEVFSHLNLATLGTICCVSKKWKRLASDRYLWKSAIYREIAFRNDKWAQCFGKDVVKDEDNEKEFASLPLDIVEDYKKFQSAFPEKNAKDSLMLVRLPKTLNGQLTLKSLGELAKKFFPDNKAGYKYIWSDVVNVLGDKSIDKSRWVLMTKDVLPGSRKKSYAEQQTIVGKLVTKALIGYEIPETLEAAVCIFAQYFDSNVCLFGAKPETYTCCKENIRGLQTVVGGFALDGLNIAHHYVADYFGTAALRKL